jgi:hypothetical protein
VGGIRYEIWDAHTASGERWWVVTNPTNLYTQQDFKSRDVVLTFHIGLAMRLANRYEVRVMPTAEEILRGPWRRWEQAAQALEAGEEAEHFQAVGAHLREAMISFTHEVADDRLIPAGAQRPRASAVVDWLELLANHLAPGEHNTRLRSYLKALIQPTWEYIQHLVHSKNSTRMDAEIGLAAVAHLLSTFTACVLRAARKTKRCADCQSYSLVGGTCRQCGWEDPDYEPPAIRQPTEAEIAAAREQPCTPSSDISTLLTLHDLLEGRRRDMPQL